MRDLKYIETICAEINVLLEELIIISNDDRLTWTSLIKKYQDQINKSGITAENKHTLLNQLSAIFADLSFHEEIEKRIEHIVKVNKTIFDLNLGKFKEPFIANICQVQIKLLSSIQNDYEISSRKIQTQFLSLLEESKLNVDISKNLDPIFDGAYSFMKKRLVVSMSLEKLNLSKMEINWNNDQYNMEIEAIQNILSFDVEKQIFNHVFELKITDNN